ncbi:MAG: type VII secretion integral membrane protein EccD [Pseudonocardiales bacterium]
MTAPTPRTPAPRPPTTRTPATGRLTRVTLVGPSRRADLVLPSDEPIGVLLPEIVTMVGLGPAGDPRGYQVSRLDGQVLEPIANLRTAGVADGTVLRVDPLTEAPPAAILHDVSDELADDLSRRPGRWGPQARHWTATVVVTVAALLAALSATSLAATSRTVGSLSATSQLPPAVLTVLGLFVLFAGAAVALTGQRAVGVATLLAGAAVAMAAVSTWTSSWPQRWALWVLGAAVTVLALGIVTGNRRAGVLSAGSALVLLAAWTGLPTLGLSTVHTATIMGVCSVAALGLLPRVAVMTSGLTTLDDRQANDEPVTRVAAQSAVNAAHRGLALACVATAASGALAGWLLAQQRTGWTVVFACLLAVALLLRLRAFPLTVEVVCLVAAALVVLVSLLYGALRADPARWWVAAVGMSAVAAVGLAVLGYQPPPHVRARSRQLADRLEGLAVVALVPVAVGVFGVYSRLLDTF